MTDNAHYVNLPRRNQSTGSVLVSEVVLFQTAQSMAHRCPEFAYLESALVSIAMAFGACVEALLLVGSIRSGQIFAKAASRLVDKLLVVLIAATVLIAVPLFIIPGPPALALALLGGVLVGTAFFLVVLVLRSLLRQAAFIRLELDEVV